MGVTFIDKFRFKRLHKRAMKIQMDLVEWFRDEDIDPEDAAYACMMLAARMAIKLGKDRDQFEKEVARQAYKAMQDVIVAEDAAARKEPD